MCCHGCEAVAEAIVSAGMSDYYTFRTEHALTGQQSVPEFLRQLSSYDHEAVQKSFVRKNVDDAQHDLREADLILEGITCAACVWLNERHIAHLPGVNEVAVNYATQRARVKWDNNEIKLSEILFAVTNIGYRAHPYDPSRQQQLLEQERRQQLRRIGLAGVLGMQVMMIAVALYMGAFSGIEAGFVKLFQWLSLGLTLPVIVYSAQPFFKSALRDLKHKQAGMDVPVALGISIAFAGSVWATFTGQGEVYYDSVVMFVFFLLTGRYFELAARKRAANDAEAMVHSVPAIATRLSEQGEEKVAAAELRIDDRVLIRPGESIAADGNIIDGRSTVDESLLTGEQHPVLRIVGDQVIGGSINIESPLIIRITQTGQDTVLSGILRLLDRAQTEKPRITQLADRAAGWFVLGVIVLAAIVATYWWSQETDAWLPIVLSVLVVTCPCALSLATPTAVTAATSRLSRLGLLVTRGHALDTLAQATHFVFDKTGTLTQADLSVEKIHAVAELSEEECLKVAMALEHRSEHPIAKAIVKHGQKNIADNDLAEISQVSNSPGEGISAHINMETYWLGSLDYIQTSLSQCFAEGDFIEYRKGGRNVVILANEQRMLAVFVLSDKLRDDAEELISSLHQAGCKVSILSGDHVSTVRSLAESLAIDNWHAALKPEGKLAKLKAMQQQGDVVAMVGDGINDAPVLAGADVSIAMASGTQLAAASADMLLLSGHLKPLIMGFKLAKLTRAIIQQNIAWAIAYNLLALPAAAAGFIAPWMAAIGMSASSLMVVGNALRLLKRR